MEMYKCLVLAATLVLVESQGVCRSHRKKDSADVDKTILRLSKLENTTTRYEWDVKFDEVNIKCSNVQRCTLMAWDSVRKLQQFLSKYKIDGEDPEVKIDNELLPPEVKFFVKVEMYQNGVQAAINLFTIPLEPEAENMYVQNERPGYLELIGSNVSYADADYYVLAKVKLCGNDSTNLQVHWEVLDERSTLIRVFEYKGTELRIPPKLLKPNRVYEIRATAMQNFVIVDKKSQTLRVLKRALSLKLNAKSLTVGVKQPIRLVAHVRNPDSSNSVHVEWTCRHEGSQCHDFEGKDNVLSIENGFAESGRYDISVQATNGEDEKSESCVVFVKDNVARTVELSEVKDSINLSDGLEITARVNNLLTGCLVSWTTLGEQGYQMLNLNNVPFFPGVINVTTKENAFIEELTDYNNYTTDKVFVLSVPPRNTDWQGLKGDVSYLFRLSVNCPKEEHDKGNTVEEVSADFTIETNAPPVIKPLWVTPTSGTALMTVFTFHTQPAKDKVEDYPILYKFGYAVDNETVYFATSSDFRDVETTLPYSESGIQTLMKVCDSRGSCADADGPLVRVKMPENLSEEQDG